MRVTTTIGIASFLALGMASASAADLPVKAPMAPIYAEPVSNWTGFYVGGHVGAGWGTTETFVNSIGGFPVGFPLVQNDRSGILGGGQIGYNFQSGSWVFGIQGDIAATDVKGTSPCLVVFSCTGKSDWLATVTGRVGGVVGNQTLVYLKGGAAWLNSEHSFGAAGLGLGTSSIEETTLGWTLGFGAEYAFSPNWSAFIEYNYADFKKDNVAFPVAGFGGVVASDNFHTKLSTAKIGVNYRFGLGRF